MIERLLTPIPELVMCRCVLGKDTFADFSSGPSRLLGVGAQPDERLANRTKKGSQSAPNGAQGSVGET